MARQVHNRDIAPVLAAAEQWINTCLIEDRSVFSAKSLWTDIVVNEVIRPSSSIPITAAMIS